MSRNGAPPQGAGTAAVQVEHVTKRFGRGADEVTALDDVSVTIRQNEFFTLLGPSGCGKTTLLRLIAGFELPSEGLILIENDEVGSLPPYKRPVNTVFQSYALFPHMTVAENIGFGLEMLDRPKAEIEDTVARMLSMVRMEALANRRTDQLSGGQQQRVALARALAPHPKVLLLDEPLSALDLKLRKEMQIELKRLQNQTGITFVFVTHDQEEALTMSDRVAVMNQGQILQIGAPKDIYNHPAHRFVADFIGDINILPAELLEGDGNRARVRLSSGQVRQARLPARAPLDGNVSIAVRPEHATLGSADKVGALSGRIANIVYFGSGTHYHLELDDGAPFVVQLPSGHEAEDPYRTGEKVSVELADGTLQVLVD